MLERVDEGIWVAGGPIVRFWGLPFPTRMTVVRLDEGVLWVHSPVPPEPPLLRALERLGTVGHLVTPNKLHHLFLGEWIERFPQARAYAAPGLLRKRPDLRFAGVLGDDPEPAWAGCIDQLIFRGSLVMEEVVFFHRPSRTVIVGDLIERFDPAALSWWPRWIARLGGVLGPWGGTPRDWRWTFPPRGRRLARECRSRMLAWRPRNLVLAHGPCALGDGERALRRGLSWLGQ